MKPRPLSDAELYRMAGEEPPPPPDPREKRTYVRLPTVSYWNDPPTYQLRLLDRDRNFRDYVDADDALKAYEDLEAVLRRERRWKWIALLWALVVSVVSFVINGL